MRSSGLGRKLSENEEKKCGNKTENSASWAQVRNLILFYLLGLATTWPLAYLNWIGLLIINKLIDNWL